MSIWWWIGFNAFVLVMLALDLGVFHKKAHQVTIREATFWSIFWTLLALAFNGGIWYLSGPEPALEFLAAYLIERALSIDNIFVFVVLFSYFGVPAKYQHRVLFWGILGALVMRGAMIAAGSILIQQFEWVMYVFGAFLIYTGIRMAVQSDHSIEPGVNPVMKLVRRYVPITTHYEGQHFIVRSGAVSGRGRWMATPLFVVLILVETSDLMFALDSIPAVFAVTQDTFLVYTSNIFAILGLRALYFLLAGVMEKFHFLKYGLAVVLSFVGVKMLAEGFYHISIGASLGIIALVLTISVLASLIFPAKVGPAEAELDLEREAAAMGLGGGDGTAAEVNSVEQGQEHPPAL